MAPGTAAAQKSSDLPEGEISLPRDLPSLGAFEVLFKGSRVTRHWEGRFRLHVRD